MAEAPQQHEEEHFDVLTRTGEKTGISKPRHLSLSPSSPFLFLFFISISVSNNWIIDYTTGGRCIGMEITTAPYTCGSTRRALPSCWSSAAPIARIHGQANGTSPVRAISRLGIPPSPVQCNYYWFLLLHVLVIFLVLTSIYIYFFLGESWKKS